MPTPTTAARPRPLVALQTKARRLVAASRDAVTAQALGPQPGSDPAVRSPVGAVGLVAAVPVQVAVELVAVWYAARNAGYSQAELTEFLGPEEKLVFEIIVGMYDTACHEPLSLHQTPAPAEGREAVA